MCDDKKNDTDYEKNIFEDYGEGNYKTINDDNQSGELEKLYLDCFEEEKDPNILTPINRAWIKSVELESFMLQEEEDE